MSAKPSIICLTPVKNEEWIIERFLKCTSLWADHIILADQNSSDRTVEIASTFEKVRIVKNDTKYDEKHRQQLLIEEARKITNNALLITLDADEFFTANFHASPEWNTLLSMPKGSVAAFNWLDVHPDFKHISHTPSFYGQWAFMDDGSDHFGGRKIHSHRIPIPENATHYHLNDIAVLHYNYVDPKRNLSKRRWYMCLELLNYNVDVHTLYRKYFLNHGLGRKGTRQIPLEPYHLDYYFDKNIDMTSISLQCAHVERLNPTNQISTHQLLPYYWWDLEVLELMENHGTKAFACLDIWNFDWQVFATNMGKKGDFSKPNRLRDRIIVKLIREVSQKEKQGLIYKIKKMFLKLFV